MAPLRWGRTISIGGASMWDEEDMKREFDGPPRATDKEIRIAFDRGATVAELAEFLCRSKASIRAALRRSRA